MKGPGHPLAMGVSGSEPSASECSPAGPGGGGMMRPLMGNSDMTLLLTLPLPLRVLALAGPQCDILATLAMDLTTLYLRTAANCTARSRWAMDFGFRAKAPENILLGSILMLQWTFPAVPAVTVIPGWTLASLEEGPLLEQSLGAVARLPCLPLVGPMVTEVLMSSVARATAKLIWMTVFGP